MLFSQNASGVGSLFALPYLLPLPPHPFFSALVYSLKNTNQTKKQPTKTQTNSLPYSVLFELAMESLRSLQVASRPTQSYTWLPCDL